MIRMASHTPANVAMPGKRNRNGRSLHKVTPFTNASYTANAMAVQKLRQPNPALGVNAITATVNPATISSTNRIGRLQKSRSRW